MNNADVQIIDRLLRKPGLGEKLMGEWGNLAHMAQNLDALQVTDKQRDVLRAALELQFIRDETASINSPTDVAAICKDLQMESQELLVVLCLNTRNNIIHRETVYKGSVNASQVRIAEVLRPCLVHKAAAFIVVHNHPSGDPTPSPDDVAVTRAMVQAGKLMDVQLLDHIVIGLERWVSMKERGLGFS